MHRQGVVWYIRNESNVVGLEGHRGYNMMGDNAGSRKRGPYMTSCILRGYSTLHLDVELFLRHVTVDISDCFKFHISGWKG